ncbi:CSLREA domain-containing protein [Candidatus Binatia bacterium]|nr:CSLREA domain-containing protein [Candidatus Binatia bacterium]
MNPLPIRRVVVSLTCLLLACATLAEPASAARIVVTTSDDVVADDGRCSLREAVNAANRNTASGRRPGECPAGVRSTPDLILLRRGTTYRLTRLPIGENANAGGDLDVSESVIIRGKGPRTVIENAIGDPAILGDGDRLFHVDPSGKGGVDVAFEHVTLARGDVGCTGSQCSTGGSVVEQRGSGALRFTACRVQQGSATCTGEDCGQPFDGAAIHTLYGGALKLRKTKIRKNQVVCASEACTLGAAAIAMTTDGGVKLAPGVASSALGALEMERVTITLNAVRCEGRSCRGGGVVDADAASVAAGRLLIADNELHCAGDGCAQSALVDLFGRGSALIDDIEMSDNRGDCLGEPCFVDATLSLAGGDSATLRTARLHRNDFSCEGASCIVTVRYGVGSGMNADVQSVTMRDDDVSCRGAGCGVYGSFGGEAGGAIGLADVVIEANQQLCEGDECVVGVITGWRAPQLETSRTRVADNLSGCMSARCQAAMLVSLDGASASSHDAIDVRGNLLACSGDKCRVGAALFASAANGDLSFRTPRIEANTVACGGASCSTDPVVDLASAAITLDALQLVANENRCEGAACLGGEVLRLDGAALTLDSAVVADNVAHCTASGCRTPSVVDVRSGIGQISRSSFSRNTSRCDGDDCAAGPGGALRNRAIRLTISDSTLSVNETDGYGGAVFNDPGTELRLERALLAANAAGLRGTMEFGGFGGAVYNDAASGKKAVLSVVSSEISRNRAQRNGGGILNEGQVASLAGSVVAANSIGDCVNQGGSGCP